MPLNTLRIIHTGTVRMVSFVTQWLKQWFSPTDENASDSGETIIWLTIKTTRFRWEAELMQQVLMVHDVSARIVDLGIEPYIGQGSSAALQVYVEDAQTALLLLSAPDEEAEAPK